MKTTEHFLTQLRRQRRWTRTVVEAIPEEHFEWRPETGGFSCGDLVRHLMQAEIFWTRLIVKASQGERLDPFQLQGDAEERLRTFRGRNLESSHDARYGTTLAGALERWDEIHERSLAELATVPDAALYEVEVLHPLTRMQGPLWQIMLTMLAHEGHHTGQLSAYLKFLGDPIPAAAFGA
jgi:uncharacterized damage-inducible protein DinB